MLNVNLTNALFSEGMKFKTVLRATLINGTEAKFVDELKETTSDHFKQMSQHVTQTVRIDTKNGE